VGYKELFDYFENKLSLNQAIDLIKQNTRRFSKRQMTWFQKNKDIKWFEHKSIMEEIVDFIESK
jgi:tRNA dimethylallyltransferase